MNNLIDMIEEPIARRWELKLSYAKLKDRRDEYRSISKHPSEEMLKRYDRDLAECEREIKAIEEELDEAIAQFNTEEHTREMRLCEFIFRLLVKFSADGSIREDIKNKMCQQVDAWEEWKRAEWEMRDDVLVTDADGKTVRGKALVAKSYQQLAEGIKKVLNEYEKMLNCYARMPTEAVANSEKLVALSEKADASILMLDGIKRTDRTRMRAQTKTQSQVAEDFGVTIGTVKNWDKGRKNSWGYDRSLRMDPMKDAEYWRCVGYKKLYDACKKKAEKEGRIWRFSERSFVDGLHSCSLENKDPIHSTDEVYEMMMRKMDE